MSGLRVVGKWLLLWIPTAPLQLATYGILLLKSCFRRLRVICGFDEALVEIVAT